MKDSTYFHNNWLKSQQYALVCMNTMNHSPQLKMDLYTWWMKEAIARYPRVCVHEQLTEANLSYFKAKLLIFCTNGVH